MRVRFAWLFFRASVPTHTSVARGTASARQDELRARESAKPRCGCIRAARNHWARHRVTRASSEAEVVQSQLRQTFVDARIAARTPHRSSRGSQTHIKQTWPPPAQAVHRRRQTTPPRCPTRAASSRRSRRPASRRCPRRTTSRASSPRRRRPRPSNRPRRRRGRCCCSVRVRNTHCILTKATSPSAPRRASAQT